MLVMGSPGLISYLYAMGVQARFPSHSVLHVQKCFKSMIIVARFCQKVRQMYKLHVDHYSLARSCPIMINFVWNHHDCLAIARSCSICSIFLLMFCLCHPPFSSYKPPWSRRPGFPRLGTSTVLSSALSL